VRQVGLDQPGARRCGIQSPSCANGSRARARNYLLETTVGDETPPLPLVCDLIGIDLAGSPRRPGAAAP
jgi:hypothetical protein